ncbi:MAG TPA: hypothetical protein VIV60_03320 [Polyangiaceae bacterium]
MLLVNNVRANVQALHSSDPESIVTALGNLTGMDGLKAYELITSHIVNRGPSKLDPQVQAVLDAQRQEIEQLKNGLNERAFQEKKQHLENQVGQHEQNIQRHILNDPTLPHLSRIMRDDPQRLTKGIVKIIEETNGSIPARQLFQQMEEEIRAHAGGAAPQGDSGGPAPKQPAPAQRSPLGQSIGPRSTAQATQRVPSEEEALKALAESGDFDHLLGF